MPGAIGSNNKTKKTWGFGTLPLRFAQARFAQARFAKVRLQKFVLHFLEIYFLKLISEFKKVEKLKS